MLESYGSHFLAILDNNNGITKRNIEMFIRRGVTGTEIVVFNSQNGALFFQSTFSWKDFLLIKLKDALKRLYIQIHTNRSWNVQKNLGINALCRSPSNIPMRCILVNKGFLLHNDGYSSLTGV